MCCAIWYYLYSLKNVKYTHRGVLLLVKVKVTLLYGLFSRFLTCQYNLYFLITIIIEHLDKLRKYHHEFQLLQLFQSYEEIPRDMKI